MGAGGKEIELLKEFSDLQQTVISFVRAKKTPDGLVGYRREITLRAFHMVGGGYDCKNPWEGLMIPKTIDGKGASGSSGSGTKMTYRYYLQDAAFAVIFEIPSSKADMIRDSLINPVWDLCLGRKSCVPTDFIYRGIYDHDEEAIQKAMSIAEEKNRVEDFRVLEGVSAGSGGEVLTLNDVPVQFGPEKQYRDRQVSLFYAG
jgi:CRISPR system Cascade subunit CasD